MSGGLGKSVANGARAGAGAAANALDEQRRGQVAQMASQRILTQPTDPAGKKMYKEAMALRTANPSIIGAPGGSSFMYAAPQQAGFQVDPNAMGFARRIGENLAARTAPGPVIQQQYTIPGAPPVARPVPTGPLDPNSVLASMRRDGMAGTRTPAQMRLAELLGK